MSEKKPLTRADIVRQRRKQEQAKQLTPQTPSTPLTSRRSTPAPVLTRNVTVDATTVRATPAPRRARQYQAVATARTGMLGAPSMQRVQVRFGWRWLSLLLSALLGAAIYFAFTLPQLQVASAVLSGNQFITSPEVDQVLGLQGQPVFLVVPSEAETTLRLNFHEIQDVHVSVQLPNQLLVSVTERQPVIRWEQGTAFTWVDAQGVAFRPRRDVAGLVVVNASAAPPPGPQPVDDPLAPAPFVDARIVSTARLLAPYAPVGSPLLYDARYGIGWRDNRGWTVWFGAEPDQMDLKLRVYVVLVDSLAQRGIAPQMINVAHPNSPYYRLGQ